MQTETMIPELQPFSECPIWARLELMKLDLFANYYDVYGDGISVSFDEKIVGFTRPADDMIYIHFTWQMIADYERRTGSYFAAVLKNIS